MSCTLWKEKLFYLAYFSSLVTVIPFLPVYFSSKGMSHSQIGVLSAARPWVSAPASFFWSALADRAHAHRAVLLANFAVSTLLRTLLVFTNGSIALLLIVISTQFLSAPVTVIVDAATVAKCGQDYGKVRLWGAIGWGTMSVVAGAVVSRFGMASGFLMHVLLAVPVLAVSALMDVRPAAGTSSGDQDHTHKPVAKEARQLQDTCVQQGGSTHLELSASSLHRDNHSNGDYCKVGRKY